MITTLIAWAVAFSSLHSAFHGPLAELHGGCDPFSLMVGLVALAVALRHSVFLRLMRRAVSIVREPRP